MDRIPRVLVAPDAFKGTFRSVEVAEAIAGGLETGCLADICPLADGGEGTAEVLRDALGGVSVGADVLGPLGKPVRANFTLLKDWNTAVVEMASASGLALVPANRRDAEAASTYGTGELLIAAVRAGAQRILLGLGGSATTDGGLGAIRAVSEAGGLSGTQIVGLCDVTTPFEAAAEVYGPQKGASSAAVRRLTSELHRTAERLPVDPRGIPRTGAAGGLAGALWATFGAELVGGAAFVLDAVGFDRQLASATAVVTGEGRLDATSAAGKLVGEVAGRAKAAGRPVHAVVGSTTLGPDLSRAMGFVSVSQATTRAELVAAGANLANRLGAA